MSLTSGTRLGSYEIGQPIGAGGMGEVYRGRDTKLHRDVAIKLLPDVFAADPDRVMRFQREAQTLAALNHSNIAQIYGVIEEPPALVMELVDGLRPLRTIARRTDPARRSAADRPADRRSTRSGTRPRDRSPRPETGQYQGA